MSNNGRSAARLGFWALLLWFGFAFLYAPMPLPRLLKNTAVGNVLTALVPELIVGGEHAELDLASGLYLSTVTITTLGYGDITPAPRSAVGRVLVSVEALSGFVLMGAFVALLVQSATVRSD